MSKFFSRVGGNKTTPTDRLVSALKHSIAVHGNPLKGSEGQYVGLESFDESSTSAGVIENEMTELDSTLDEVIQTEEDTSPEGYSRAQRDAAAFGALGAVNRDVIIRNTRAEVQGDGVVRADGSLGGDPSVGRMQAALEAYDESENRNAMVYSFVYNLKAARQDEFGEKLFPTVVLAPDQAAVEISMDILSVEEEYHHEVDGTFKKMFGRKNVARALIHPDILNQDTTRVIPVYRPTDPVNVSRFVDPAKVPPKTVTLENEYDVVTAPLAVNKPEFALLGISSPDYLIQAGLLNQTDQLDPFVQLANVYIELKNGKVVKISELQNLPQANFNPVFQGNNRSMNLNFEHAHAPLTKATTFVDQSEIDGIIKTGELTVRMNFNVSGRVNLNDSTTRLMGTDVYITDVYDKDKNKLAVDDSAYKQVETYLENAKVIGVDLIARRVNTNRRERGQIMALNRETQRYMLPILAPITYVRPPNEPETGDGTRLESLVLTTNIRCSNAAVRTLLTAEAHLATLPPNFEPELVDGQTTLGMARYLLNPWYDKIELDVAKELNTLQSSGRLEDVQAVLVNAIRDMAFRAYLASGYQAASHAVFGSSIGKPTVIVATDPYVGAYLMVQGDMRTLGDKFNVEIVTTSNIQMRNKIRIVFGKFEKSTASDVLNPLHFGNMFWRPELVSKLPISRGNTTSRELTVQPSFIHVVHTPIMGSIDITNLPDAVTKMVPIFNKVTA